MVRIISGGLKGEKNTQTNKSLPRQSEPKEETGLEQIKRVGTAAGFDLLSNLQSLFTTLPEALVGRPSIPQQQNNGQISMQPIQYPDEMLKEAYNIKPEDLQSRSFGESAARFVAGEAPFWAAQGARKLPQSIASSLGMLGGAKAGGALGGSLGEQAGNEGLGELLGNIGGGIAGAGLTQTLLNRPTKTLAKKIPVVNEQKIKLKEAFEGRNKALNQLKQNATQRENLIKELDSSRKPLYEEARSRAKGISEPASNLLTKLENIESGLGLGLESADELKIRKMINQVGQNIGTGKFSPEKGKLALDKAKAIKLNINTKLNEKNLLGQSIKRTVVGEKYKEIRNALNEFISDAGKKHPLHAEVFEPAELKTAQMQKLIKDKKQFIMDQKELAREVNADYRNKISDIKEDFRSKANQEKIVNKLFNITKMASPFGAGGLGYVMLGMTGLTPKHKALLGAGVGLLAKGGQEVSFLRKVFKEHPEIYKEYINLIGSATKSTIPSLITKVNLLGDKLESLSKEEQPIKNEMTYEGYKIRSGGLK